MLCTCTSSYQPTYLVGHGALVSVLIDIHSKEDTVHAVHVLEQDQTLGLGGELVGIVLLVGR